MWTPRHIGVVLVVMLLTAAGNDTAAQNWQPSEVQKNAAERTVIAYFKTIDGGDYSLAHTMLAPSTKEITPKVDYIGFWQDNKLRAGELVSRRITGVTWYPKRTAEGTGVAVAIDYEGSYTKSNIYCGYLALVEMPGGTFDLLRDDITLATTDLVKRMPAVVRQQLFDRPGCRRFLTDDR